MIRGLGRVIPRSASLSFGGLYAAKEFPILDLILCCYTTVSMR